MIDFSHSISATHTILVLQPGNLSEQMKRDPLKANTHRLLCENLHLALEAIRSHIETNYHIKCFTPQYVSFP
jgi:hypothetical protein